MDLHAKQIGNIGEMKIATDLMRLGYYVFTELGDICKADLMVMEEDYRPYKVQVKCYKSSGGKVILSNKKSGPSYSFRYERKHIDIYALYVYDLDITMYVPATYFNTSNSITIRVEPSKNGQAKGINFHTDFLDFAVALDEVKKDLGIPLSEGERD